MKKILKIFFIVMEIATFFLVWGVIGSLDIDSIPLGKGILFISMGVVSSVICDYMWRHL